MGIKIIGGENWVKAQTDKLREREERELNLLLSDAVATIKKNGTEGRDFEGRPFGKSYTAEYAKYRKKIGRSTSPIDLTVTRDMFRALTYTVKRVGNQLIGEMFFNNTASYNRVPPGSKAKRVRTSAIDKARGNQARFGFFGLNTKLFSDFKRRLRGR